MREVEVYENVPDRSELQVSMSASKPEDEGKFTGHVLLITSFEPDEDWPDAEVHLGPRRHTLEAPHAYMLEIHAAFQAAAQATVVARIVKPNGEVYSVPKVWTIDGDNETQEMGILFIRTAQ